MLRNALCAVGSFAFVFVAGLSSLGMAATGGFGGHHLQRAPVERTAFLAPSGWASAPRISYDVTQTSAPRPEPELLEEVAFDPASFSGETELAGGPDVAGFADYYPTEAQVSLEIERDYFASAPESAAASKPGREPAPDQTYIDKKHAAAI
ncbi:MAG: hypothetical protein WDM79_08645 [Terricaulis sp.]